MAHYAKVLDGKVTNVIVAGDDFLQTFVDNTPGQWIQTSYNTRENEHLLDGTPLRGNFAGIGMVYDSENDVFYYPQPFPSWTLNQSKWTWQPPTPYPADGKKYDWNESTTSWVTVE
jgi:hypothetical protein